MNAIVEGDDEYPSSLARAAGRCCASPINHPRQSRAAGAVQDRVLLLRPLPRQCHLSAYDQAARWRDTGRCVISGFHSDIEAECLRILLRGTSPIILCPARSLPHRLPPDWKKPLDAGHLLILSGITGIFVLMEMAQHVGDQVEVREKAAS